MPQPTSIATGRRKTSVARVRLYEGTGTFALNGKALENYFPTMAHRIRVLEPIRSVGLEGRYDVSATLHGGGKITNEEAGYHGSPPVTTPLNLMEILARLLAAASLFFTTRT